MWAPGASSFVSVSQNQAEMTLTSSAADNSDESGATAVEYALLIALIAAVVVAVVALLGPMVGDLYSSVCTELGC